MKASRQIYNETIRDCLLVPPFRRKIIHETDRRLFRGQHRNCRIGRQANVLVRKAAAARKVEATQTNAHSSRSHTILFYTPGLTLREWLDVSGALNLVDLAGSERVGDRVPVVSRRACAM